MNTPRKSLIPPRLCCLITAASVAAFIPGIAYPQDDDEIIIMNPFTVSSDDNAGYVASNSVSGTRSQTPIRDIPLNIQVFTEDFADDFLLTSQVDLERYNASLVNGGDDPHSSNVIQQAYNAFLFRGFVQNWAMRDGVRQYDPVDSQGLSRVELVKGPVAAMYGLTYPGGVMNAITKNVIFGRNFVDASATVANEGEWRTTLDMNVQGESDGLGRYGIRYNGAYSETRDSRAHSDGMIEFNQVNLAFAPTSSTLIELLGEWGYREHPALLGYFTTPETSGGVGLGNSSEIPLQIIHPEIPWDWNWSTGNMRSLDTEYFRARLTQSFGENFSVNLYASWMKRIQVDSDGLDAAGSGSPASWDMGFSGSRGGNATGWINPGAAGEAIVMHYHHRDWQNRDRAFGGTALFKFDAGPTHHVLTAGANYWRETFVSHKGTQPEDSPNLVVMPVTTSLARYVDAAGNPSLVPTANTRPIMRPDTLPPPDFFWDVDGAFGEEFNDNEYFFASWQGQYFDNSLRTIAAINYTKLDLTQYANGMATAPSNVTEASKTSPLLGVMWDVIPDLGVFAVYSTSLFPTTDKDDFENQLPPVTGKSYEFGFKFDLIENKLSGTVSYYMIDQEGGSQRDPAAENRNKQRWDAMTPAERAINFPGITDRSQLTDRDGQLGNLVPGAVQESRGWEADLVYQPTQNWQMILSYAHNKVETAEATNPDLVGKIPNAGHIADQLAFITKYSFLDGAMDGLTIGLGGQWADGAFQGYVGDIARYNPDTFWLEAFVGYRFQIGGIDSFVQLNAKNLTREPEYVGWRATGSSALSTSRYEVPTDIRWSLTYRASF